jgi:signal transduction histidine kinase
MIRNLKDTTKKTKEQDWLKTNLARFTRMLQGQRDLVTVAEQTLSELAPVVSAQHGLFYMTERPEEDRDTRLKLVASYAASERAAPSFELGEGLVGQCARDKRKIVLLRVPDNYVPVRSGLGEVTPSSLVILPVLFEGEVNAVMELACMETLTEIDHVFLGQLTESLGIVVNTIAASMRTEALLLQSQSLTQELQTQQEELRQTNDRLEHQAATLTESQEQLESQQEQLRRTNEQLEEKAKLLELKNREVELAKAELEDKAAQLALTSKYKSEFLANMSHELRTPLNSLLILSKMLADNVEGNLSQNQVEFARTIESAGTDLLALINDILDLSKIESGTIAVDPQAVHLSELREYLAQSFRHIASQKGLEFRVEIQPGHLAQG